MKKDPEDRIRSVFSYLGKTIYMRLLKDYPKSKRTVQLHERAEAYLQQPSRAPYFINLQYKPGVLKAALARVDSKFLPALKLSLEDKPYKDIAGQLGISIELVKTRIFRARRQFRKALLEELKKSNPARD